MIKTNKINLNVAKRGISRIKNIVAVFDILFQSQDNFVKKIIFFAAFFIYYIGRMVGLNVSLFPKMGIWLEGAIFLTRSKTIDFWMVWKGHEREITRYFMKIPVKGTFVDVGAHIGRYSILMAKKGGEVYSFEPISSTFKQLKLNPKANGVLDKIKAYNLALGPKKEKRDIFFNKAKYGEGSLVQGEKGDKETIQVDKLDNIIKKKVEKPVILKIDVEGFEYEVLLGAKNFIRKNKPEIIIEIWNQESRILLSKLGYYEEGEIWYPKKK